VGVDGTLINEVSGVALSVGWNSIAIAQDDGSLTVTDASLGSPVEVARPGSGVWASVGGPLIPSEAPPVSTGAEQLLVALVDGESQGAMLVAVGSNGVARTVYQVSNDEFVASWSRAGDWIVVVEETRVTLVLTDGGDPVDLGDIVPPDHWVLSIG
jgi:spermidine/putrescine-binding protein